MDNEFILDAREYISLDMADHPHPIDHFDPPSSNSMSPVPSAASTPPTTTNTSSTMASFAPVAISSQPSYSPMTMSLPSGYPRRAEHSYLHHPQQQHQQQQQFGHHHHHHHQQPYSFGAPPPPPAFPKLRAPQLPTTAIMQTAAVHPPSSNNNNVSDLALSSSANEPDAPPSGTGGSRKRPKYTRSKKGCLTCRSKKIKCDERKPMCTRCEHGHRECTWPEAVLPRRPKGAVRGVGDEGDGTEDDQIIDQQQQRRPSIPGSAVSTQFPSSATSTHFNGGIPTNSPFEPAPPRSGRDVFESDVYPAPGSQFSMPAIPANARSLYPRAPGSADFYPVTTVNGQPIDDYEFPPRQQQQPFGSGASSSRSGYTNNALYATGPPGAVPAASYNGDLRRASWDSSAPTDGRRPSWDANSMGAHASSVSSPASSTLGLGLGGIIPRAGSSNAGGSGATAGPNNNGLMLFQSPDPLSPFFRSVQERNLIKHYCHSSANIIMALPPTPNPILAVTLPIVLDKPPGTHAPTEALRLALLGVGAVHIAYLSSRRRVCVGVGAVGATDVVSPMGVSPDVAGGEADAARMMGLSSMLRLGATRCLAVACRNPEETRSDAALGATMAVTLIDIFSGGHQWTRNINLAKTLIALRGGPAAILNSNLPKQARFGGGVTVSPARFWLEMLAVYETFGSLTSGEEPTLLAPGNTDWWFDDAHHSYHANSIEKVFGMARSMVTLIAKVSAFLCRSIRERAIITESEPLAEASIVQLPDQVVPATEIPEIEMTSAVEPIGGESVIPEFDFEKFLNDFGATPGSLGEGFISGPSGDTGPPAAALTPRFEDALAVMASNAGDFAFDLGDLSQQPEENVMMDQVKMATLRAFFQDAKELYTEVENWEDTVGPENREARVLVGNKTHKLALQIIMLRDIFHVPRTDDRVQAFAASILDLCIESSQQNMGVDLTWPVIIAGCQVMTANARMQVAQAFDSFRKQCCFEIESSERIVAEVWRRVDNNEPRDDWRAVVEDEGLRILVL